MRPQELTWSDGVAVPLGLIAAVEMGTGFVPWGTSAPSGAELLICLLGSHERG